MSIIICQTSPFSDRLCTAGGRRCRRSSTGRLRRIRGLWTCDHGKNDCDSTLCARQPCTVQPIADYLGRSSIDREIRSDRPLCVRAGRARRQACGTGHQLRHLQPGARLPSEDGAQVHVRSGGEVCVRSDRQVRVGADRQVRVGTAAEVRVGAGGSRRSGRPLRVAASGQGTRAQSCSY